MKLSILLFTILYLLLFNIYYRYCLDKKYRGNILKAEQDTITTITAGYIFNIFIIFNMGIYNF